MIFISPTGKLPWEIKSNIYSTLTNIIYNYVEKNNAFKQVNNSSVKQFRYKTSWLVIGFSAFDIYTHMTALTNKFIKKGFVIRTINVKLLQLQKKSYFKLFRI